MKRVLVTGMSGTGKSTLLIQIEPLLRASATLEVVTTVPVTAVIAAVLAHVS